MAPGLVLFVNTLLVTAVTPVVYTKWGTACSMEASKWKPAMIRWHVKGAN